MQIAEEVVTELRGENAMCRIMEELIKNMEKEIALNLLKQGKISKEDIAECVGLLLEEVNELEQKMEVVPS